MIRRAASIAVASIALLMALPASGSAAEAECNIEPRSLCFGVEALDASLSTNEAGAHPDLTFSFDIAKDPTSKPNGFGLKDAYAPTRDVRIELPPGLIGDPNVLGPSQQCKAVELNNFVTLGCPNGSQVGLVRIFGYGLNSTLLEPLYMMQPPGGDTVARLGFIAGVGPLYINATVRSESDYGLTLEGVDSPTLTKLIRAETTTWGVPADPSHDTERCTPQEVATSNCTESPPRPPGSSPQPFLTNPTRCAVPLEMRVSASSWIEPNRFDTKAASFPEITGCDNLPFGPGLTVRPTSRRAASPSGAEVALTLPAALGVKVREPAQMRALRVKLPNGLTANPGAAEGLETCSEAQVRYGTNLAAQCPDAAKLATTEFDVPVLERKLKGAVYLREPEPGNLFRIWIVADDLGLHIKLKSQLEVDKASGQITAVTTEIPQAPIREAKLNFFSGSRASLITPSTCGEYRTEYEFIPWSGGPAKLGSTPMTIDEGCDTGGFAPRLSGGATDLTAGQHSPFLFTLTREDGEQNPQSLDLALPRGLAATFTGLPRCDGPAAVTGACPPASQIGRVTVAVGAGPDPLWAPQRGKRPTAVYLGGPYRGAPFSVIAVVPAQAGPFDLGDQVVRSAIHVDPVTARATVRSDPFPQILEGIPIDYRTVHVIIDRPHFTLNPTSCRDKSIDASVTSDLGAQANAKARFGAVDCSRLKFKPRLSLRLRGATHRGAHPSLEATLRARPGDANFGAATVALPRSEFLDQGHIGTVCTRVQFAAKACPKASIYGRAVAKTPLLDQPLRGPVYLRSSSNPLPDLVMRLEGEIEVELAGRIDSINGGIRSRFRDTPDAPLTSLTLKMFGGKKGLLVNSTDLCAAPNRADVDFRAQNGRHATLRPVMQVACEKSKPER